jgi:hypothetical protein
MGAKSSRKRAAVVKLRPGASPGLAANQLMLTFPEAGSQPGCPYTLADLKAWAERCGVSLHDVAVAATAHAFASFRSWNLYGNEPPLNVSTFDDALTEDWPPVGPRRIRPYSILVQKARNGETLFYLQAYPDCKTPIGLPSSHNLYVFAADFGRLGYLSKVGITDDIEQRAGAIWRRINKQPLYLVAWWSFTSERGARRFERKVIESLRRGRGRTLPQDWFPIFPSEAARIVAVLADELGNEADHAPNGREFAQTELQWRPMPRSL